MATFNYLVTIATATGTEKLSLLEVDATPLTGLSGGYRSRLANPPNISTECDVLGNGIAGVGTVTLQFLNDDNSLSAMLTTDDPRGREILIHEHEYETTEDPVSVFSGIVKQVEAVLKEGESSIQVTAEGFSAGLFDTILPAEIYEQDMFVGGSTDVFGDVSVAEDVMIPENFGQRAAVVFQGTREHVPMLQIKADPETPAYVYLGFHSPTGESSLVQGYINTVYRQSTNDGKIRAIPPGEYAQGIVTDKDGHPYQAVSFSRAQRATLRADVEAFEYDTLHTGALPNSVQGHWLFRNNTLDESGSVLLQPNAPGGGAGSIVSWFEFTSAGTPEKDESANGHDLTQVGGTEVFSFDRLGGTDAALLSAFQADNPHYTDTDHADYDFGTGSFHIECQVLADSGGTFDTVKGWVFQKAPSGTTDGGYIVGFTGGVPFIELRLWDEPSTFAGVFSLSGGGDVNDGFWHKVVWEVDRTAERLRIYIDDDLKAENDLAATWAADWTVNKSGGAAVDQYVLATPTGTNVFVGTIDYLKIVNGTQASAATFAEGASGQSTSSFVFGTNMRLVVPSGNSKNARFEAGAGDDIIIMSWFKMPVGTGNRVIAQHGDMDTTGYGCYIDTNDKVVFRVAGGTARVSTIAIVEDDNTASPYNWNQVWCIADRAGGDLARVVINGVEQSWAGTINAPTETNADFNIGDSIDGLDGTHVDEVMVAIGPGAAADFTVANVRTQYMTAIGNPARMIRRLMTSSVFGLGVTIDSTSFDDAEDELEVRGIRLKGAVYGEEPARSVIEKILSVYGMVLGTDGTDWTLNFAWRNPLLTPPTDTTTDIGYLDDTLNNIGEVGSYTRLDPDNLPQSVSVRFFGVNDSQVQEFFLYQTNPNHAEAAIDPGQGVVASGVDVLLVDMQFVRDWEVADRIRQFYRAWLEADTRMEAENVAQSLRVLVCGARVTVNIPAIGVAAQDFRVVNVGRNGDKMTVGMVEDARTAALDWSGNKTNEVTIINPDSSADYRFTIPPAPTALHITAFEITDNGVIVTIKFTMPSGIFAEEMVESAVVRWRRKTTGDTEGETSEFEWNDVFVPVRAGATTEWAGRGFQSDWTYQLQVKSVSPWQWSQGAMTVNQGLTAAEFEAAPADSAGHAGVVTLEFTPPKPAADGGTGSELPADHPNFGKSDPAVMFGDYGLDRRINALGSGVKIEQKSMLSDAITLLATPEVTPNVPCMIVNGMPWLYTAAGTSRGQFQVSGTTINFQGGGAPDGTPVIAIYTLA